MVAGCSSDPGFRLGDALDVESTGYNTGMPMRSGGHMVYGAGPISPKRGDVTLIGARVVRGKGLKVHSTYVAPMDEPIGAASDVPAYPDAVNANGHHLDPAEGEKWLLVVLEPTDGARTGAAELAIEYRTSSGTHYVQRLRGRVHGCDGPC